jgi:rhodanese-related sulfurtransferase
MKNIGYFIQKWFCTIACILCLSFFSVSVAQSATKARSGDLFPLRDFYPTVQTMSTETLLQVYDEAIIIDVRSQFEFDVVRINKAAHVDFTQENFLDEISALRSKKSEIPLIFYCNDPSCSRGYRAVMSAESAGYSDVYIYDPGVFSLLKKKPQFVTLMGTTPAQTAQVISKEQYEKAQLDFASFKDQSNGLSALVIDIRDIYGRELLPDLNNVRNIPMEALLQGISHRIWAEKKLLILDHLGDQTQSLQYFLEANGYTDYAFLRGGVQQLDSSETVPDEHDDDEPININQNALLVLSTDSRLLPIDIELMTLIIAKINFENYSVINQEWAKEELPHTIQELQQAAARLQRFGYLLFSESPFSLIFHIDPRLAWKGKMSGILWSNSVSEFKTSTD